MSNIYVVTNTEHGWDCVEKVFSTKEKAYEWVVYWCDVTEYPKDIFIVHEKVLDE